MRRRDKKLLRRKRQVAKLSGVIAHVVTSKNPERIARGGKHRWKNKFTSLGAASEVRHIVKDGQPVDAAMQVKPTEVD